MSALVTFVITHPTTRTDGSPADDFELAIAQRAKGDTAEPTPIGTVASDENSFRLPNVPGGEWEFRFVWLDLTAGQHSAPLDVTVAVPFAALNQGSVEVTIG